MGFEPVLVTWPPLRLARMRCERGSVGVVCPPALPYQPLVGRRSMRRCIGLDVDREFAEVAIWQDGIVRSAGRIETTPEALRLFAGSLCEQGEVGLNPRVRQSGGQPASHGRITKQGRAHARGMLVEAAWVAVKTPGPLRAFYERVRARRGMQIAVVATARKLAVLCWHMITRGEDYSFARPSLTAKKLRALELQAGMPARRGQKGRAASYSLKDVRAREKQMAQQAERAYRQLVADWQAKAPAAKAAGVAAANGARLSRPSNGATAARQDTAPDPALRSGVDHARPAG